MSLACKSVVPLLLLEGETLAIMAPVDGGGAPLLGCVTGAGQ